ncbi:MAG: methyltransferase [Neptuniibacter sp.]
MKTFTANNINIYFHPNHNGGGMDFGQDYIKVIAQRYGKPFNKVYEFCSGPGFIGFSLLGAGQAEHLILSDLYEPLNEVIEKTVESNGLEGRVNFYNMPGVKELPEGEIDLVVSNPPHFLTEQSWLGHIENRIYIDENWEVHREFYHNIASKLSDDGIVLFQENALGSGLHDFELMISEGGLQVTDVFSMENRVGNDQIYYIEAKKC